MKKLNLVSVLLCLCISGAAFAVMVVIKPGPERFGCLLNARYGYNGDMHDTSDSYGYICYVGDRYAGLNWDLGVAKFELPTDVNSSTHVINSARIKGFCARTPGTTFYLKIQRYANDNTTPLGSADHPNSASLIDVGIAKIDSDWININVTDAVTEDISDGKSYSSFLLTPVKDANGTPLDNLPDNFYFGIYNGWSPSRKPQLDIDYSPISSARQTRVYAETDKIGTLLNARYGYNGVSFNTPTSDYIACTGDIYVGLTWCLGVAKFELPTNISSTYIINNAHIDGYCYRNPGTLYLKIQRYLNDNTTVLGSADHPNNASVEDVKIVQVNSDWFSLDVTSGVQADVAAGKSYSSFLITPVKDASGTPLDASSPEYYYMAINNGWSDDSTPHLDIDYTPASGTQLKVYPRPDRFGALLDARYGYNGVSFSTPTSDYVSCAGDIYTGLGWCLGVAKFELPANIGSSYIINSARINGYCYRNPSTFYIKIQRYTNDNTTALGSADHPSSASLVNVGIVKVDSDWFSLDVTAGVQADVNAGKTYSSFLLTAVKDPSGTPLDNTPEYCYMAINKGWSSGSRPYLALTVEPLILGTNATEWISIHTDSNAPPMLQSAADELQDALLFAIKRYPPPPINPTEPCDIQITLSVDPNSTGIDDDQAYVIRRTLDDNIDIIGNSEAAVMWAVGDFCKKALQVYWPIDGYGMTLGKEQSLFAFDQFCIKETPDFEYRGWIIAFNEDAFCWDNSFGDWMMHNRQSTLYCPMEHLGYSTGGSSAYPVYLSHGIAPETTTHSFNWFIPKSVYWTTHPEYFPFIDNVRKEPVDNNSFNIQLCLSNPDVFDIFVTKINDAFQYYPELKIVGICQNDGRGGFCQCANCRAWDGDQLDTGNYSNRVAHFVNLLATEIGPGNLGKKLGMFGYSETRQPPDVDLADNVAVTFAPIGRNYMKKFTDPTDSFNAAALDDLYGWLDRANDVHFYDYYFYSNMDCCPSPYARRICEEYPDLLAIGVTGVSSETYPKDWPGMRVLTYTTARAGWDTSLDYNDILSDYCYEAYGPAASDMKSYHLLYENTLLEHVPYIGGPLQQFSAAFTSGELTTLEGYLASATTAAAASTDINDVNAVQEQWKLFQKFKLTTVDPAKLPGIGTNVVRDSNTEDLNDPNWKPHYTGNYVLTRDSTTSHDPNGNKSLKIQCFGTNGLARWYQLYIPVTPDKKYALRFWVRGSSGSGGHCELYASKYVAIDWMETNDEWKQIVVPEFSTAGCTYVNLYLATSSTGTVYFDDIFMAELAVSAAAPDPANSATGVNIEPTLSWTSGSHATSHDVYFGTNQANVTNATRTNQLGVLVSQGQTGTTYSPTLTASTTYYWRIDEVSYDGITTGTVWSFTTAAAPGQASSPSPTNSATSVSINPTLSWTAGSSTTSHDVYFSTNQTNVTNATHLSGEFKGNQAGTNYSPGTLANNTSYYWRIDEVGNGGTTTGTVWNFTTVKAPPTYQAAGTAQSSTGNITVPWPTHQTGDVALLFIESCGGQAANLGTPAGFAAVTNSPQLTGTGTAGTRLTVYWCRATSSSMSSPVVTDPGDHVYGRILTFRGVTTTGNPWDVTAGGVKATASTSTTFGTVNTAVPNTMVVLATSRDNDSSSAAWSSWTNANLTSLTERLDEGTTQGNGGGIGVATGIKATADAIGPSTATVTSSVDGHMTISLKP